MDKPYEPSLDQAQVRTLCLIALTIIATITALKLGQSIFAPILLGLTVGIVMGPVVRRIDAMNAPPVVGALFGLLTALMMIGAAVLWAGPILSELLNALPKVSDQLREWIEEFTSTLRGLEELEDEIAEGGEDAVGDAMPTVMDALWLAPNILGQALIAIGTLFFFLLTRNALYTNRPKRICDKLVKADRAVSHYFLTITAINLGLGVAVSAVLTLIGIPDPMVWGAAAFVLNFVLYLGPAIMVVSLLIAGVMQFSGGFVLVPPAAYLLLNMTEAQFVTPAFVGKSMSLNPLAVFLAIVFGLWLWGPIGGVLALPALVWVWVFTGRAEEAEAEGDTVTT